MWGTTPLQRVFYLLLINNNEIENETTDKHTNRNRSWNITWTNTCDHTGDHIRFDSASVRDCKINNLKEFLHHGNIFQPNCILLL